MHLTGEGDSEMPYPITTESLVSERPNCGLAGQVARTESPVSEDSCGGIWPGFPAEKVEAAR